MEPDYLAELILMPSLDSLGYVKLGWAPQPGSYLDFNNRTYAVLERRHRYQLKSGRYCLSKVLLYVQPGENPHEKSLVNGCWVIGDATCIYNARSEIIRCAVNPDGPCDTCLHYEKNAESEPSLGENSFN